MTKSLIVAGFILSIIISFWLGTKNAEPIKVALPSESRQPARKGNTSAKINYPLAAKEANILNESCPPVASSCDDVADQHFIKSEELKNLEETLRQLKKERSRANTKYNDIRDKLIEAGLEEPEYLSLDEVERTLPAPFSSIVASGGEYMAKQFKILEAEEIDFDWGAVMQMQINDFIISHEFGIGIDEFSVRCKTTICEIRGFDSTIGSWNKIQEDLVSTDWWQFNSTSSTFSNDESENSFFYILAQK